MRSEPCPGRKSFGISYADERSDPVIVRHTFSGRAARVLNCSATMSGAWFGSMVPLAPTYTDGGGARRDVAYYYGRRGAGNTGTIVVFGERR